MSVIHIGNDLFEYGCDMVDVTSISRPDTNWRFVDKADHEHRWHVVGKGVATSYDPNNRHEVPGLVWVKDGVEYLDDDGEPHYYGHSECAVCGDRVNPGYTPDDTRQFIPGLRYYRINGKHVDRDEFKRRLDDAFAKRGWNG